MGYKIGFWNGIHRAKKLRDENPKAAARFDVEAVERDKQTRIPRVEVPPEKKEENKEGTDEEYTHMEGEVTSELDGPTDTTATEAVNESGAAKRQRWWGGWTIIKVTGGGQRQRTEGTVM